MASGGEQAPAEAEPLELVLFQVAECYVYLVRPPHHALRVRFHGQLSVLVLVYPVLCRPC